MPFPNQNNQQRDTHVNTRGVQFFNLNGFEPSTLIISMWNQLVSLRIHPAKDKSQQTKTSVYDYDKSVGIILDNKTACLVASVIKEGMIPALKNNQEFTKGVAVGNNSAIILSTGVKRSGGKPIPYMSIARNIKPGTLLPEEMLTYTFNTSTVLNNYDGLPGNKDFDMKTCTVLVHSELSLFADLMKHMAVALVGAEYHAGRNINKKYDDNVFQLYKGIAAKYGLEFYSGSPSARSYDRAPSVFGSGSVSTNDFKSTMDTKPEEVGSIEELDLDAFAS
jgi:hypothetical protein